MWRYRTRNNPTVSIRRACHLLIKPPASSPRWPRANTLWRICAGVRSCSSGRTYMTCVTSLRGNAMNIESFRREAFDPGLPLLIQDGHRLPAKDRWFLFNRKSGRASFSPVMQHYQDLILPYEFVIPRSQTRVAFTRLMDDFETWLSASEEPTGRYLAQMVHHVLKTLGGDGSESFYQFNAPLGLLISASRFNEQRGGNGELIDRLYIAQSNLADLPGPLSDDVPSPEIVRCAGKGDVYSSSIWLGLQPTYTPLHRDPNPNLFCQLVSSKLVRLVPPDLGSIVYTRVRRQLGSAGNSRFRGSEMMDGPERDLLHTAIWETGETVEGLREVEVKPGDALFIPKGWWHSVKSSGNDTSRGMLNASVNWWFR